MNRLMNNSENYVIQCTYLETEEKKFLSKN